jgi:hypothetical protein
MNAKKFYFTMIALLCVLIIGAGAMIYFGSSFMKKKSNSLVNAKLDSYTTEQKEKTYLQARKDLEKNKDLNDLVAKILPKDKDQAKAVSELYKIAAESNITIDKIQFPSSTLGQKAVVATGSTASSTPAPAAPIPVTQSKAVDGLKSVMGIDIDIYSGKSMKYNDMISFLQKIELNRRSMQVKKITVTPDLEKNVLSFNVTVTTFVKP